jgi:hypothetical protein
MEDGSRRPQPDPGFDSVLTGTHVLHEHILAPQAGTRALCKRHACASPIPRAVDLLSFLPAPGAGFEEGKGRGALVHGQNCRSMGVGEVVLAVKPMLPSPMNHAADAARQARIAQRRDGNSDH